MEERTKEQYEVHHMNVKMFFDVATSMRLNGERIICYMILNCNPEGCVFEKRKKKDIAKALHISDKTVSRHIKRMEDTGTLVTINDELWQFGFYFEPDEYFEKLSGAEPHTCFAFFGDVAEDDEVMSKEEFEANFRNKVELWESLQKK